MKLAKLAVGIHKRYGWKTSAILAVSLLAVAWLTLKILGFLFWPMVIILISAVLLKAYKASKSAEVRDIHAKESTLITQGVASINKAKKIIVNARISE